MIHKNGRGGGNGHAERAEIATRQTTDTPKRCALARTVSDAHGHARQSSDDGPRLALPTQRLPGRRRRMHLLLLDRERHLLERRLLRVKALEGTSEAA